MNYCLSCSLYSLDSRLVLDQTAGWLVRCPWDAGCQLNNTRWSVGLQMFTVVGLWGWSRQLLVWHHSTILTGTASLIHQQTMVPSQAPVVTGYWRPHLCNIQGTHTFHWLLTVCLRVRCSWSTVYTRGGGALAKTTAGGTRKSRHLRAFYSNIILSES